MEVVLLEKLRNLGDIGDKVKVKAGFARNFLLPQGKAATATAENMAKFEEIRAKLEQQAQESLAAAKSRATDLAKLTIKILMRASEEGNLFGSVGPREVVAAVQASGMEIDKKEIVFPEGPIHQVGEFEINLQLHTEVTIPLKINVIAEE